MQEFVEKLTQQFGISESQGESVTSGLLNMAKSQVAEGDFSQLLDKIPGAKELVDKAPAAEQEAAEGGGGMLGGLAGMASSALGGKVGAALGLASILKGAGLDMSKAGSLISMFVSYLKEKLGGGLFEKIQSQMPDLQNAEGD